MSNLFSRAKAYCKQHPRTSYQDAIKLLAKKTPAKKAAAKKAVGKKPKKAAVKKVTIRIGKVKPSQSLTDAVKNYAGKNGITLRHGYAASQRIHGIAGISLNKVKTELQHQQSLQKSVQQHQAQLKQKGLRPAEKAHIRREISHYKNAITSSKRHVSALKRSI